MKPALRLIETIRGSMTHFLLAESCKGKTVSMQEEDSTFRCLLPTAGTLWATSRLTASRNSNTPAPALSSMLLQKVNQNEERIHLWLFLNATCLLRLLFCLHNQQTM